ncbi:MAG: DUF2934 domain-containing protein [Polyangiaceae bacterium]|jgi:hypothetical protein|nr:DUF2934 domain-containing protein [Polyangiaceae bacterium]
MYSMATRKTGAVSKLATAAEPGQIEITKAHKGTRTTGTRKPQAKTLKMKPRLPAMTEASPAAPVVEPSRDQIAERAYYLFLQRGWLHGADVEDWLQAEHDLRALGT